ncbi:photosystem reaction center subunit H [Clostridium bovifaecis]|uniref:Photosystem reaction center subunit H n=1 Tax=Clostridium bovifaecis TaxID=2184719 RepID=A0A6I6ESA2_9CLOT|nr:photosystem reaction center subunit H [Clostridium bovifaecis]
MLKCWITYNTSYPALLNIFWRNWERYTHWIYKGVIKMYRSKDFILMDVIDISGKKLGFIKDILINFHEGYITGFSISSAKLFKKKYSVKKENIITFNSNMVVSEVTEVEELMLSDFKGMDVVDNKGDIIGRVEDVIFNNEDFKISGVIVSTGFVRNLIYGKQIYLIKELILGNKNILYFRENANMHFSTMAHELLEVDGDE